MAAALTSRTQHHTIQQKELLSKIPSTSSLFGSVRRGDAIHLSVSVTLDVARNVGGMDGE